MGPPLGGPAVIFLLLGLLGGGPAIAIGLPLRRQSKQLSGGLAAIIVAFVSACLFLGVIVFVLWRSAAEPASGPIDLDFLVLGLLIAVTGTVHLASGFAALWGRLAMPPAPGRGSAGYPPRSLTAV